MVDGQKVQQLFFWPAPATLADRGSLFFRNPVPYGIVRLFYKRNNSIIGYYWKVYDEPRYAADSVADADKKAQK